MSGKKAGRREFLGIAGTGIASLLLFGTRSVAAPMRFRVSHSAAEWKQRLGSQRFEILREAGTERPFSSPLLNEHRRGIFACAGCREALFASATKFESGTGWPSFWQALSGATVKNRDRSLLIARTEILCARCGGHLGHVFDDGPMPTGLRYCMNGLALTFRPA